MSIPFKARGMRLSDEVVRMIDEAIDITAPMFRSRTAMVSWEAMVMHIILTNERILWAVEQAFQEASRSLFVSRVYDTNFSATSAPEKPGPQKLVISNKGESRVRWPRITSQQFTATVLAASVVHRNASRITSFGSLATPRASLALGSYSVRERVA